MDGGGCFVPSVKAHRKFQASREKNSQKNWRAKLSWIMFCLLFFIGIWVCFSYEVITKTWHKEASQIMAQLGFKVEDVIVIGRSRTTKEDILKKLNVVKNMPMFLFDPHEARDRLKQLNWVKSVSIERRLPETIVVKIKERSPVAIWYHQSKKFALDEHGSVIEISDSSMFKNLLRVSGAEAPKHLVHLIALLGKFPQLKSQITAAKHLRADRWDISIGQIEIRLPETNLEKALTSLEKLETQYHFTQRDIATIDMRLPDQLILRLTPEAEARKNIQGNDA